jgi:hypothetical protein
MGELFPNGTVAYLQGGLLVGLGVAVIYLTVGVKAVACAPS